MLGSVIYNCDMISCLAQILGPKLIEFKRRCMFKYINFKINNEYSLALVCCSSFILLNCFQCFVTLIDLRFALFIHMCCPLFLNSKDFSWFHFKLFDIHMFHMSTCFLNFQPFVELFILIPTFS